MKAFPYYRQLDVMDCGPTCLRMICKYYGKRLTLNTLRKASEYGIDGVSLLGLADAADKFGLRAKGIKVPVEEIINDVPLPAILHWNQSHFVVLMPASTRKKLLIADPAKGIITLTKEDFISNWVSAGGQKQLGIALVLEPTPAFYQQDEEKETKIGWGLLLSYLKQQKQFIGQLAIGLLIGTLLQLIFPFLTQSIVDTGINTHNLQFIYIILIAQFMLFFGRTVVEFIRSRLLLYISTHINVSLLSDFWIKLMKLPLHYFDTKQTGDILQRLQDQHRIESFLTGSTLSTLFSLFNLLVFSVVLLIYNTTVFAIFLIGSILYIIWIRFFLRYRRSLDYKRFAVADKAFLLQQNKILNAQKELQQQDAVLAQKTFAMNDTLMKQKVISALEYRNEQSKYLNKQQAIPQINSSILANENGQNDKDKEISELKNTTLQQKALFIQALQTLKSSVEEWKRKYILTATADGNISLTGFLEVNQTLQNGQTICYISGNNNSYYVQMLIPQNNFGKVKEGQEVLLKFQAYPSAEWGSVRGKVDFISRVPTDSGYVAKIVLPKGLMTDYNKPVQYHDGLIATGEIITADRRLLQQLYYNLYNEVSR